MTTNMEELEETEKISTENDEMITMTMVVKKYWMKWMMSDPEESDAADILMQLSGSVSHSGCSTIDSPGAAGSKSSNKGDADNNNKLVKLPKDDEAADDEESFCATAVAAAGGGQEVRLSLSSSSSSSSSFRPAVLQKRGLVDDADDDEDLVLIEMGCGEIEGYPLRRKREFRSIIDLYAQTKPFPQQVVTKKSKTRPPRRSTN